MAQGVLTGKYLPGQPVPENSRAANEKVNSFIQKLLTDEVLTKVQELKPIAEELGVTMAQFALAWVLQNKNVSSAIVGATTPDQIKSNLGAVGVEIPAEVMAKVTDIFASIAVTDPKETRSPESRLI
jgi:aryl-alcohol dehydrogenase-like predicted oxidoreductase